MPRGVAESTRSYGEGPAREIHKIVQRHVSDESLDATKQRWLGAVLNERLVEASKPITYRYQVREVYRDDLKRLIAVASLVEDENG